MSDISSPVKRLTTIRTPLEDCPSTPLCHVTVNSDLCCTVQRFDQVESILFLSTSVNLGTVYTQENSFNKHLILANSNNELLISSNQRTQYTFILMVPQVEKRVLICRMLGEVC